MYVGEGDKSIVMSFVIRIKDIVCNEVVINVMT